MSSFATAAPSNRSFSPIGVLKNTKSKILPNLPLGRAPISGQSQLKPHSPLFIEDANNPICSGKTEYEAGLKFCEHNQDDKAISCFKTAAQMKYPAAFLWLSFYENDPSQKAAYEQEVVKNMGWFEDQAKQGDAQAQTNLGHCYEYAAGVGKNDRKAFGYYDQAAKQGHFPALYKLGFFYENGKGVAQDSLIAMGYYKLAARGGSLGAQKKLEDLERVRAIKIAHPTLFPNP